MKLLPYLYVLLFATIAEAQQLDTRRHVEVDGTSKILADVDRASWQIKIRGEAATLEEASKILDRASQSLQGRLKEGGFDDGALRLSGIASGKHYETTRETKTFKGYYAERPSIIEIKDLSKRQVLETLLLADNNIEIVNISLRSSKHDELRKQALLTAVAAAKDKATFLAEEAGATVGILLAIREGTNNNGWANITENRIAMPLFGQNNSSEFEKLEYSATVTVKYELK